MEIQQKWYTKCVIILVIIGATGIVTEGLQKNVEAIPGEHHDVSLLTCNTLTTKTDILETAHIIRKVLQAETLCLSGGDHRWFKSTRKSRIVTTDNIIIIIIMEKIT